VATTRGTSLGSVKLTDATLDAQADRERDDLARRAGALLAALRAAHPEKREES
jgi:hypothetical protein